MPKMEVTVLVEGDASRLREHFLRMVTVTLLTRDGQALRGPIVGIVSRPLTDVSNSLGRVYVGPRLRLDRRKGRKTRPQTPEERARKSEQMKRYWADRRAAKEEQT